MIINKFFLIGGTIGLITLGAIVAVIVVFAISEDTVGTPQTPKGYAGGIATNGYECASIGRLIFMKNGSAVDAAVATLLCEGIAMPHSMGIGGGFLMTIYIHETKEVLHLTSRETAPLAADEDMFNGNASIAAKGGLSIAVPGELKGYYEAWKRFGKIPWKDLIQPTIELCRNGHLVTAYLAKFLKTQENIILNTPTLREVYINPATNKVWQQGDVIKRLVLAKTLEVVAEEGANALYNGSLTKQFVKDIQDMGGIITEEDMHNYQSKWEEPMISKLPNNLTLYSSPLPGSGVILQFMTNILSGFLDTSEMESITNYQRIIESFKYAYGKRTELGDPSFIPGIEDLLANLTSTGYADAIRNQISDTETFNDPEHYGANTSLIEDHGTANIAIIAPNGDAVTATSTINLYFGSNLRSTSTGIILNDEMDDFSAPNITNSFGVPPSPNNYIRPGKRPMSSMCPTVIIDGNGKIVLAIGAAGGTKITTSVALVTMRHLWFGMSLEAAMDERRFHHQLFPMKITFETGYNQTVLDALHAIGHDYEISNPDDGFAAVTAVSNFRNHIEAAYDKRRTGSLAFV